MKGVVFNLVEAVVTAEHGPDAWDDLLDAAQVSAAYTSLGNYDDAELEALVAAAETALGQDRAAILRWVGRQAIPRLADLYPDFFTPHTSAQPFVRGVNDIIHAEVRKLYVGASCPHFGIRDDGDAGLTMTYRSARRMCALAHGFIEGAADYYCETVELDHLTCVDRGDPQCEFRIRWVDASDRVRAA